MRICLRGSSGVLLSLMLAGVARGQEPGRVFYQGVIDGKLAISMSLRFDESGSVTGGYSYATSAEGLGLLGTWKGKKLALEESTGWVSQEDPKGISGRFRLVRNDDGSLAGDWTSADGKRTLSVAVAKVAESVVVPVPPRDDVPPGCTLTNEYLRFPERNDFFKALNKREKAGGLVDMSENTYPTTYCEDVTYADASLVSIIYTSQMYDNHESVTTDSGNFVWRDGKLVDVELQDLIDASPATLKALRKMCVEAIKGDAERPEQLVFTLKEHPGVNVTRAGLEFTISGYDVGDNHMVRVLTVMLPWKKIGKYVPEGSPIRHLVDGH